MAPEKNKELTPEEINRKDRVRKRLFILLIILDILLAGYLVFEMIVIIQQATSGNKGSEQNIALLYNYIRNVLIK